MMRGLFLRAVRESYLLALLIGVALLLVDLLLGAILPQVIDELNEVWMRLPFARTMVTAWLGVELAETMSAQLFLSILWVHPVVLSLVWAFELIFCTRVPAGEIDRGTIDILLGLPVSRRAVYLGETLVWLVAGVVLLGFLAAGYFIGTRGISADMRPNPGDVWMVIVNFSALYLAVGGLSYLISSMSNRRGRAIGAIFGILLASFLLNFIAQFWVPAKQLAFLGILNYYQPAVVLGDGVFPTSDILVLAIIGTVTWVAGGEVMARRSICTT
jgi:ABC-2 type transport system permease protein